MKQSRSAWLPVLRPAVELSEALVNLNEKAWLGLAHCPVPEHPEWERQSIATALPQGRDVVLAVGPEGDFSPEEIHLFAQSDFTPVTMGEHRLRTETAALFAVQAFHLINALK